MWVNSSDLNHTVPLAPRYNVPALILGILLIVLITGGNVLVCLSVHVEKALKTTTNYFIVSLAAADLMLALMVLPLFVYSEFQGGVWTLNMLLCDGLMTMDVLLCTASIFNLCAISVDRLLPVLLDAVLRRPHNTSFVFELRHPAWSDEHRHLAGLRQQCSQPHHLHRLQHRVQEILQEVFPQLLLSAASTEALREGRNLDPSEGDVRSRKEFSSG